MSKPIVIYTTELCPCCRRAKKLLRDKGLEFEEIAVDYDPELRAEMVKRANGLRTVPQIFFGDRHIGGSDELHALNAKGELDPLLAELAR